MCISLATIYCINLGPGALSRLLPHYHRDDNMDRASQVLAQGVLPGVPRSNYSLLASPILEPAFSRASELPDILNSINSCHETSQCSDAGGGGNLR